MRGRSLKPLEDDMNAPKTCGVLAIGCLLVLLAGCATPHSHLINGNEKEALAYINRPSSDINTVDADGDTLLMKAIWKRQAPVVAALLQRNPNLNIESKNGSTALGLAISQGDIDLASRLIARGADPHHVNKSGLNLVFTALAAKSPEAFELLARHRVNLNPRNNLGVTPLALAIFNSVPSRRDLTLARKLVELGADPDVPTADGRTPLMLSIESESYDFAEYLLARGVRKNPVSHAKVSAIHLAISKRQSKLVRQLITPETINQRDARNNTPLIGAAITSQVEIVRLLLAGGALVNPVNDFGAPALSYAAKEGDLAIVETLLAAGADPRIGLANQDPLAAARFHKRAEVIARLEAAMGMSARTPASASAPRPATAVRKPTPQQKSTGSGVRVSESGFIVTNAHVVEGCTEVRVAGQSAQLIAQDKVNDLALIKGSPGTAVNIRTGSDVKVGESVIVVGFPLSGLLGTGIQASSGDVSALSGVANDSRVFQISAPVNPGNSGGPLFDRRGNLIGIVRSKLDAMKMMKSMGDVPQNINFAIKSNVLTSFLQVQAVRHKGPGPDKPRSNVEIVDAARETTFSIECWSPD